MRRQRLCWLGLTPEPERDLPLALAVLRAGGTPEPAALLRQRQHAERVVLRGKDKTWLAYIQAAADHVPAQPPRDPVLRDAAVVVAEVVLNHHRLLAGMPGQAYDTVAPERRRLRDFLRTARGATA